MSQALHAFVTECNMGCSQMTCRSLTLQLSGTHLSSLIAELRQVANNSGYVLNFIKDLIG